MFYSQSASLHASVCLTIHRYIKQQAKSTPSGRGHYGDEERPLSSASDRDGSYDGRRSYDDDSSQGEGFHR